MRTRLTILAVVIVATVTALPRLAAQSAQQPVFRSGVDLVTIDVTVVGEGGRPLDNLGAEQFEVKVDGTKRRIVRAVYVQNRPQAAAAQRAVDLSSYFSSNDEVPTGRLLLIAVDQQHIRRVEGLAALRAAADFVDQLDPADRVAAAPVNHVGPLQFTNEHAGVKKYLQGLAGTQTSLRGQFNLGVTESLSIADGQRTWLDRVVLRECGQPLSRFNNQARIDEAEGLRDPCPVQVEQESRALAQEIRADARASLNQLLGLIARLAEIDEPKTLVLVSEGLIAEPQLIDLSALGAAAQVARVTIYVLQLEQPVFDAAESVVSPTLYQDLQMKMDGLVRLAGSAKGAHFRLVGADPYPFQRILREMSGYYLLAFEASAADRDGRTRRIDVSTNAPGAIVRARPLFRSSGAAPKDGDESQIVRLLRNPRIATELPVRATAYTFRDSVDGKMRVILGADADGGASQQMTFGYVLIDSAGVIASSGSDPAVEGRFTQVVSLAPGRYSLKVAAIDTTGRQGSVERVVDARLIGSGGIGLSDLTITDSEPGQALRPVVAGTSSDTAGAVLEIYGPPGWKPQGVSVRVEVKPVEGSSPGLSAPASLSAIGASTLRARAELKLRDLPAGAYVATAHVTMPGGAVRRVERGFLK
jgi:VWFA-related protein